MPGSFRSRPTTSHEHVFMFSKSNRTLFWQHEDGNITRTKPKPDYVWRNEKTGEEVSVPPDDSDDWQRVNRWSGCDYYYGYDALKEPVAASTIGRKPGSFGGAKGRAYKPGADDPNFRNGYEQWGRTYDYSKSSADGRNARSVWTIPTFTYKGAHFATMPPDLAERCIKAGSREGDVVADMFGGSGTTCLVADRWQRHGWGIELNPAYAEESRARIVGDAGMFADVTLIDLTPESEARAA
jgi:hypothetical protein